MKMPIFLLLRPAATEIPEIARCEHHLNRKRQMTHLSSLGERFRAIIVLCSYSGILLAQVAVAAAQRPPTSPPDSQAGTSSPNGLKVSDNHHFLVDARTGNPFFLLADTAWNLNALTNEEIDAYLHDRRRHGFNCVMFCLDFYPQAASENAFGQRAYGGQEKTDLNPAYFAWCDRIVDESAGLGMYVMLYAMWGGKTSGTMNTYSLDQLHTIGLKLGARYKTRANVILVAGGESTPPNVEVDRVNAIGSGLKDGCEGKNLVAVHPCSDRSSSQSLAKASPWLDFYMSQVKSGKGGESADLTRHVAADFGLAALKPTMVAEHRYEIGTREPPVIQRRSLYLSVFAGAFGYAYGHNALWQMTPHTAQPWMLKGWPPDVSKWTLALDTIAVDQLQYIKPLLSSRPYLQRIPDQSLILAGQGKKIADRVQATRDVIAGGKGASYIMVYLSAPQAITVNTSVIDAKFLNALWFSPETGQSEPLMNHAPNPGKLELAKRPSGEDWVVVIDDAAKNYPPPSAQPAQ